MRAIFVLILLIAGRAYGQDSLIYDIFPAKEGNITYERTIDAGSTTILTSAKRFAISHGMHLEDTATGSQVYKGGFIQIMQLPAVGSRAPLSIENHYSYTLIVQAHNGKAKITLSNLMLSGANTVTMYEVQNFKALAISITKSSPKRYREAYLAVLAKDFKAADDHISNLLDNLTSYISDPEDF